jgi:hypothetical protein
MLNITITSSDGVGDLMVLIAMSASSSPRSYLFDLQLQTRGVGRAPGETSVRVRVTDLKNAPCTTDTRQGPCPSPDDVRDCGCTTTDYILLLSAGTTNARRSAATIIFAKLKYS